ncbi:MAG: YhcH/YjgK/YiaL family protein [Spirochaetales bacterium]|nr:YhcH/YjgK/YiaL family protein [Spirochaetales bacterium]
MIIDHIKISERYEDFHPSFKKAFNYIRNTDLYLKEPGRYELEGENLFILIQEYDTADYHEKFFETHRQYIDIQYIVSGFEMIGFGEKEDLTVQEPYRLDKDIEKYKPTERSQCRLNAGYYSIFYPGEAHMPGCTIPGKESCRVKKLVVKIKM